MNGERIERIRARLQTAFTPLRLEIEDESHLHAGHAGARSGGGHYRVLIVSADFRACSVRERHRAVYSALEAMMSGEIHALSIRALAPGEVE